MRIEEQIQKLKSDIRGELIEPQDAGYDDARKVYNGMINKRPRLIVRVADVADVIASVRFTRETGLLVAVRGGGQGMMGHLELFVRGSLTSQVQESGEQGFSHVPAYAS